MIIQCHIMLPRRLFALALQQATVTTSEYVLRLCGTLNNICRAYLEKDVAREENPLGSITRLHKPEFPAVVTSATLFFMIEPTDPHLCV